MSAAPEAETIPEIERRFLVERGDIDPEVFDGPHMQIRQAYLGDGMRIRIIEGIDTILTRKEGHGLARTEHNIKRVPPHIAEFLFDSSDLRIEKRRYVRDGWEIDVFEGALTGLILLERELESADEPLELPSWVSRAVEVTDSLSNQALAHTARLHRITHGFKEDPPPILIPHRFPRIVLTGGPCSGKSEFMETVRSQFPDQLHCVPEAATIVILHLKVSPPSDPQSPEMSVFQRNLIRVQAAHEETAELEVRFRGKYGLVLDRGYFDNAAYLPGGRDELRHLMGGATKEAEAMASYDLVVCMAPPPRDVYERMKANNPARKESYEEACALSAGIIKAWQGHPNFHVVDGASWEEKLRSALALLNSTLARHGIL